MKSATSRLRRRVSITIDPDLLEAVDLYVQRHAELDRSKVMDAALSQWYTTRQEEAMIEQFGDSRETSLEQKDWHAIRRLAAGRRFNRPRR